MLSRSQNYCHEMNFLSQIIATSQVWNGTFSNSTSTATEIPATITTLHRLETGNRKASYLDTQIKTTPIFTIFMFLGCTWHIMRTLPRQMFIHISEQQALVQLYC